MPKPRYWAVEFKPNRSGRPRWYFRPDKKLKRIRLPDGYGSPEFDAAYRAAFAGQPLPVTPGQGLARARRASIGKLGWLIGLYLQNRVFTQELKPATQRPRRAMLEKLGVEKGHVDIEDVDKGVIQASVNARADKPLMAGAWLYAVKAMFDWATREYMADPATGELKPILADNPCLGVRLPRAPKPADPDEETGHPEFSDNDLDMFETAYPLGTLERRVYEAIFCSGLRVGDAARFGRQHVMKDGSVRLKTEKTGAIAEFDIVDRLKRALAAGPHPPVGVANFLVTQRGKPWDKGYLGSWFGGRCRAIGLARSAHGLRKSAARIAAEAGATEEMLMAQFTWSSPAMAHHYVRAAKKKKLTRDAQRLRFGEQNVVKFPPSLVLGGGSSVNK
jgi:integrase